MLTALWGALWAAVGTALDRLGNLMKPIVVDTAVELAKTAANTPEYKPSTQAESVATEEVKTAVLEQVRHSELWDALHKK